MFQQPTATLAETFKTEMGLLHARAIRGADSYEMSARMEARAIDCLSAKYDETGDVLFYLDMEAIQDGSFRHMGE